MVIIAYFTMPLLFLLPYFSQYNNFTTFWQQKKEGLPSIQHIEPRPLISRQSGLYVIPQHIYNSFNSFKFYSILLLLSVNLLYAFFLIGRQQNIKQPHGIIGIGPRRLVHLSKRRFILLRVHRSKLAPRRAGFVV